MDGFKMKKLVVLFILPLLMSFSMPEDKSYPKPEKTKERYFYIQRNLNSNTIVYDAIYDENGYLIEKNPLKVYYIRYNEDGSTKALNRLERMFAYGARAYKKKNSEDYNLKLVAYKKRPITIKQVAPYKVDVLIDINGKQAKLDHLYIFADNSKVWPLVKYIELFGYDLESNKSVYEKIIIND